MHYLEFRSVNPVYNLALEEAIFEYLAPDHPGYFILWRNSPAIIIGRHQIASEVVNSINAKRQGTPIIRRNSGGGAVYHDDGNLNFSFIQNIKGSLKPDLTPYMRSIAEAIAKCGIDVTVNARNDLEYHGRKFSGNSQLIKSNKLLHHGTLLVNADLERMQELLLVDPAKFKSHGVASLAARVINLCQISEINIEQLKKILAEHCAKIPGIMPKKAQELAQRLAATKYSTWEWNYGKSPACDFSKRKRLSSGEMIFYLKIKGEKIQECKLQGDFINLKDLAELEDIFKGCRFTPQAMRERIKNVNWPDYLVNCDTKELECFFCEDIFNSG